MEDGMLNRKTTGTSIERLARLELKASSTLTYHCNARGISLACNELCNDFLRLFIPSSFPRVFAIVNLCVRMVFQGLTNAYSCRLLFGR